MMENLVLIGVLVAVVLVMASGVWVATALVGAVWHVRRPVPSSPPCPAEQEHQATPRPGPDV